MRTKAGRIRIKAGWLALLLCAAACAESAKTAIPRLADGHPDFNGFWNNSSLTTLERAADLAGKEFFTAAEADAYEKRVNRESNRDRRDGTAQNDLDRAYNEAFFDRGTKVAKTLRTSLVVDPKDGRVPPLTPEAAEKVKQTRAYFAAHPADGPESLRLQDRCILFPQVGPPMLPGGYNNNYQIVQTAGFFVIHVEMGDVARVIPIAPAKSNDAGKRLPANLRSWNGDSRAHWEGDTLVVDSINFRVPPRGRIGGVGDGMADENLHIIERFTRTDSDTIIYRATVDDPTVYTHSWTVEVPMSKAKGPVYEYACHEGNYGLAGILSGERVKEKEKAPQ